MFTSVFPLKCEKERNTKQKEQKRQTKMMHLCLCSSSPDWNSQCTCASLVFVITTRPTECISSESISNVTSGNAGHMYCLYRCNRVSLVKLVKSLLHIHSVESACQVQHAFLWTVYASVMLPKEENLLKQHFQMYLKENK